MVFSCPTKAQQRLSLSGNDWKIKDIPNDSAVAFCSNWIQATVPGNIQADLETARILNPLWYGMGDKRLYDVAKNEWVYRKEFKVPADFSNKRIRLVFDGVDYACEVWLNGKKLGNSSNMFRTFEFDVASILKIGETNRLEIRIESIPEVLAPYIEKGDGKLSAAGTEWYYSYSMTKTIEVIKDLKSPTNWGYDWGVNIWTLGIWKDVRLEASGPAVINNIKIETPLTDNYTKAKVQVNATVNSLTNEEVTLRLKISGNRSEKTFEKSFSLKKGSNKLFNEIELKDPALWWPNGHGEQNLYTLEAILVDGSGKELHSLRSRFGIREVRWELTSGALKDFPEKYMPVINGRKIRMIGSNLIPPDLLFARIPDRAFHLLRMANASGFTALRLWGGGVIFTPEVYDFADELGILLTQEIPIANIDPKPDPEFLKNLDITLPNIIRQVWNHPSIIEYTGGNEMDYGWGGNLTVIRHIRKIFAEVDPGRVFRDTDPTRGGIHGPWHFPLDLTNTSDPLGVYSMYNSVIPQVPDNSGTVPEGIRTRVYPFMRHGEFGYPTSANLEVWQRDIPPPSQWPFDKEDPVLIRKNVTYAIFDNDNWLQKPVIDFLFGESPDLEFLLKAGQYIGAEGLRYAVDAIRRRGTATAGMMTWDFNEPWTNGAGSYMIDYDGRPLMNYAFAKQAMSQLSLSLRHTSSLYNIRDGIRTTLYLSSDADNTTNGLHWSWKARDRRGKVISSGKGIVGINSIEVKKLADITVKLPRETAFGPILMELQLTDSKGKIIHERIHIFGLRGVRSPLKGLLDHNLLDQNDDPMMLEQLLDTTDKVNSKKRSMPEISRPVKQTSLRVEPGQPYIEDEEEVLELKLTNTGTMTALFCEPRPVLNYRTDLIIENLYVCIPPGESRTIKIRAPRIAREGLTLSQTGWRVESWNANPVVIAPSEDILLALGREDRMCREFAGYPGLTHAIKDSLVHVEGRQPDPSKVPYLLDESKTVEFRFKGDISSPNREALLRIHTSDQSTIGAVIKVEINGKSFELQIPEGYGFQKDDPSHLARVQTVEMAIPKSVLKQEDNLLRIKVIGDGWFTWDALDLKTISIN